MAIASAAHAFAAAAWWASHRPGVRMPSRAELRAVRFTLVRPVEDRAPASTGHPVAKFVHIDAPAPNDGERPSTSIARARAVAPADAQRSADADLRGYRSPADVACEALPRSAPDTGMIEGLPWSGLPLRLRLFIDGTGRVLRVVVLQSSESDEVIDRVRRMFEATGFSPARLADRDVPSYKDIELAMAEGSTP